MIHPFSKLIVPKWQDARWPLLLFLFAYCIFGIHSLSFTRVPEQLLASVVTCVGLDVLILFYKRVPLLPLSAVISSMGVFLLTNSPTIWAYVLVGALTILSKHLILVNGRHVFNPNNFGVVAAILFFPAYVTTEAAQWGGTTGLAILIFLLGALVVWRAHRSWLVSSYVATFILGVILRALIGGKTLMMVGAPMTGAAFHLFIFYMISDPMTTPRDRRSQLIFGVTLAVLDNILRFYQMKNAPFYSLFVIVAIYSAVRGASRAPIAVQIAKPRPGQ